MPESPTGLSPELDRLCIDAVRVLAMDAVQKANSGHPGTPMALAPLGYLLWTQHLRHNPADPAWADRDRFVLSVGHASMLIYSLLHLTGYDLSMEEIVNFRQWGLAHTRASRAEAHAGRRDDHWAARPGRLELGGDGARRAMAGPHDSTGPATTWWTTTRMRCARTEISWRASPTRSPRWRGTRSSPSSSGSLTTTASRSRAAPT